MLSHRLSIVVRQRVRRAHPRSHLTLSFLFRSEMATKVLMEGLFPNLWSYLSGRSRQVSDRGVKGFLYPNADCLPQVGKQDTKQVSEPVSPLEHPEVESATEPSSSSGNYTAPAQGLPPLVQAEAHTQIMRPVTSPSFGMCHPSLGTTLWLTLSRHPFSKESQPSQHA